MSEFGEHHAIRITTEMDGTFIPRDNSGRIQTVETVSEGWKFLANSSPNFIAEELSPNHAVVVTDIVTALAKRAGGNYFPALTLATPAGSVAIDFPPVERCSFCGGYEFEDKPHIRFSFGDEHGYVVDTESDAVTAGAWMGDDPVFGAMRTVRGNWSIDSSGVWISRLPWGYRTRSFGDLVDQAAKYRGTQWHYCH
jgi:hypothetical protein